MFWKLAVIGAYALVIVVVGVMGLRRTQSFSDFFLGGGKVGSWMTAFTYGTAYFSAVVFIGFAGTVGWNFGYSGLWIAAGNTLVGVLAVWLLIGPAVRRMAASLQVATMPEFFARRFNSRFLQLFAPLCIFVFFIPYSAAVFIGLSYLFTASFGISFGAALAFMGSFTALYVVLGGYRSMATIDVFFGVIMVAGVSILLWSTIVSGGGIGHLTATIAAVDGRLVQPVGPPGWWPLFSLVFLTSVAPMAMPQLVQKFYAIKDEHAIRVGRWASTAFALLICGSAYFIGATTRALLSPESAPRAFTDGKPIFDALIPELLTRVVHPSLSIVILLLILSASMSTLAALVLISSSSLAKDLYADLLNPGVSDRSLTLLMRLASAGFIALSVVLAWVRPASIVAILGVSWGAIGSAFLGPFLWGLFWRRATRAGAVAAALGGLGLCLILYATGTPSPAAGTVGMIASLVLCPAVSLLSGGKNSTGAMTAG